MDVPVATQGGQQVVNVAADEAAKAKIDDARARALKGEDFVKLVGELSDSGSKSNGGLISGIVVNDLSPDLAGVLTKLKPGDVSEPIRSAKGYAIFKLESRVEAVPEPFDKVRDRIAQKIYDSRMEGEQKKYLEKLRTQALIEWKDEGYHQMYDKARATKAGAQTLLVRTLGPGPGPSFVMLIGSLTLDHPVALAPMAGMTDTAFRRLVKRLGGCGLVVTEMVSSEGLVRGIDRTLEYAEYTEEERPVSIQIFGGDPDEMADAAQIVEGMGADIVDINMGCPVPKIAKHNAGCSLMREPGHAASVVRAMARAVKIPVTVKMRAGLERPADQRATSWRRWSRTPARPPWPCTAEQPRSPIRANRTGSSSARSPRASSIPVFGSGDCVEAPQVVSRLENPACAGCSWGAARFETPGFSASRRMRSPAASPRAISLEERGQFLLEYIDLLFKERVEEATGFRHAAPGQPVRPAGAQRAVASGGSSTRFARSGPGTPKDWTADRTCGWRSTQRSQSHSCGRLLRRSSCQLAIQPINR